MKLLPVKWIQQLVIGLFKSDYDKIYESNCVQKIWFPNVFELLELGKPRPGPSEVLIKVFASTVTAADCMMRRGNTILSRILLGLIKPGKKYQILGTEFSGMIEETGSMDDWFLKYDKRSKSKINTQ